MAITELRVHYYFLLDIFLIGVFMLRKTVNSVSLEKVLLC